MLARIPQQSLHKEYLELSLLSEKDHISDNSIGHEFKSAAESQDLRLFLSKNHIAFSAQNNGSILS